MSVKRFKMSLITHQQFWPYLAKKKRLRPLSQRESQKFTYIIRILNFLNERPAHVREIIKMTRSSPKSVVGSLNLLAEKQVVTVTNRGNKKVYQLNPINAKSYALNGLAWRIRKRYPKTWRGLANCFLESFFKRDKKTELKASNQKFLIPKHLIPFEGTGDVDIDSLIPQLFPPEFKEKLIQYKSEYKEITPYLNQIQGLTWSTLIDLLIRFRQEYVCRDCLENGYVSTIIQDHSTGEIICEHCGSVLRDKEMIWKPKSKKRDSFDGDDQERDFEYVRGKPKWKTTKPTDKAKHQAIAPICPICSGKTNHLKSWHVASQRSLRKGFTVYLYQCVTCDRKLRSYTKYRK